MPREHLVMFQKCRPPVISTVRSGTVSQIDYLYIYPSLEKDNDLLQTLNNNNHAKSIGAKPHKEKTLIIYV